MRPETVRLLPAALLSAALLVPATVIAEEASAKDAGAPVKTTDVPGKRAEAYYHFVLGSLEAEEGHYSQAAEELERASKLDGASADIRSELSAVYLRDGRMEDALRMAREAVGLAPSDPDTHRSLAEALTTLALRERREPTPLIEAVTEYRKVVELGGDDGPTLSVLGKLEMQAGFEDEALATFRRMVSSTGETLQGEMLLARALARTGDGDEAIEHYENVLAMDPTNMEALSGAAALYEQNERWLDAAHVYATLADIHPDEVSLRLRHGISLLRAGRAEEALGPLTVACALAPDSAIASRSLAVALQRTGRPAEALERYEKLLAADPEDVALLMETAALLEERGEAGRAAEMYERALAQTRDDATLSATASEIALSLANLRLFLGSPREALDAVEVADKLSASWSPESAYIRCRALLASGAYDGAGAVATRALGSFPDDFRFQLVGAEAAAGKGDEKEADRKIARAIEHSGEDRRTVLMAADVWVRREEFDRALPLLEQAVRKAPDDDRLWFEWGGILERAGRPMEAMDRLRHAIDLNAENHLAMNYLGYMLAERGENLQEAESLVNRALSLDPQNPAYLDSLGWVLYQMGRPGDALGPLSRAAELMAGDSTIREHLGDVLDALGRRSDAIEEWNRALDLGGPKDRLGKKISPPSKSTRATEKD